MTRMNTDECRFDHITERIIAAAFKVHNELGAGFYEKVFENSLVHEMRKNGMRVEQQVRFTVVYDGVEVGLYVADLIVEGCVLVEVKAVKELDDAHVAQAINFLAVARLPVGLVVNFGQKVKVRRVAGAALRTPGI